MKAVWVGLSALAVACANVQAQDLAAVAKREKERRAKVEQDSKKPVKTYDEQEASKAVGGSFYQPDGPPLTTDMAPATTNSSSSKAAPSASASPTPPGGAYLGKVAQMEARLRTLEDRRKKLPPTPPGGLWVPQPACVAGAPVPQSGAAAIELRDQARKMSTADCERRRAQEWEAQQLDGEIQKARAELERARAE